MIHKSTILRIVAFAFLAGLALASCSRKNGPIVVVPNCAGVGIVKYMGTLTRFNNQGQTNEDVDFEAYITDLDQECSEGNTVETDISFTIRGKKGPAFSGADKTINYFVVVIRDNYLVVTKKKFTTRLHFKPGSDTASVRETIRQTFDDYNMPRRYDYEILVGFEVSPDELEFNVTR